MSRSISTGRFVNQQLYKIESALAALSLFARRIICSFASHLYLFARSGCVMGEEGQARVGIPKIRFAPGCALGQRKIRRILIGMAPRELCGKFLGRDFVAVTWGMTRGVCFALAELVC
jgi:hypothetical protein